MPFGRKERGGSKLPALGREALGCICSDARTVTTVGCFTAKLHWQEAEAWLQGVGAVLHSTLAETALCLSALKCCLRL